MTPSLPDRPKLYHIVHRDRLPSIDAIGHLLSDAAMARRRSTGTTIGIPEIKERRRKLPLKSRPGLRVGACVPFYFSPRSVMLWVIHHPARYPDMVYRDGQEPIVHLQVDLGDAIDWAESRELRWAFTTSNAGAFGFRDYSDRPSLVMIDWEVVMDPEWYEEYRRKGEEALKGATAAKQAEFLVEQRFPWSLVERIGVFSEEVREQVLRVLVDASHVPDVEVQRAWYH